MIRIRQMPEPPDAADDEGLDRPDDELVDGAPPENGPSAEAGSDQAPAGRASGKKTVDRGPHATPLGEDDRPLGPDRVAVRLEALLFASGQALTLRRLCTALDEDAETIKAGLSRLTQTWADRDSAIEVVEVSGGWRLMTRTCFEQDVARLRGKSKTEKLSPAALETLAVVAYRQPLGRADIEAVRGVQCGPLLRVLLDRDLIRIAGRSAEPGHPLLYGTTKQFLAHFGLASLKNLPDIKDLLNVS
jgi:segregation and condensation protein B